MKPLPILTLVILTLIVPIIVVVTLYGSTSNTTHKPNTPTPVPTQKTL